MSGAGAGKWADLAPRIGSGVVMALVGIAAIWAGGGWFLALVAGITGALIWEIRTMSTPDEPLQALLMAGLSAGLILVVPMRGEAVLFIGALCLAAAMALKAARERVFSAGLGLAVLIAGYGLVEFRTTHGAPWLFWLLLVVIVTDIMGYFAGRIFGGPKFWPSISPKKTWSGTVAGWIGAALVGGGIAAISGAGRDLVWISVLVSFASQLGDIAESAFKRRVGVKDSSALIPGHGGAFDRFDGMLGASLFMLILALIVDVPEVRL